MQDATSTSTGAASSINAPGAAPKPAKAAQQARSAEQASTSASVQPLPSHLHANPLPEKHFGNLRGGRYPFMYDPGYGLPVVQEVTTYGGVLAAIREGRVTDILWFPSTNSVSVWGWVGRRL